MKFQFLHKYRYEVNQRDQDEENYLIPVYNKKRNCTDKLYVTDNYIEFIALHPTYRRLPNAWWYRLQNNCHIYGAITHITITEEDPIQIVRSDLNLPFEWNKHEKFYIRDYISKKSLTARDLAILYSIKDCLQTRIMFNPYHSKITRID